MNHGATGSQAIFCDGSGRSRQAAANPSFQRYFGRKTGEIIPEADREIERQREKERAR